MRAEIRKLWQALGRQAQGPPVQKQMPFSWSGTVSGTRTSGSWYAEQILTITGCTLGAGVPGGSQTTAVLLVNGVGVYTFVLPGGQRRGGTQMRFEVNLGDRVQFTITGGGCENLTAFVSYVTAGGF